MAMPGDHITIEGDLIHPIAMEEGLRFAIREEMCIRDSPSPERIVLYIAIVIKTIRSGEWF